RRHGGCGCARRMSYENGRPSAAAVHASEKERSPRQGPGRRCSSATPRAKLSPTEVDTDIGCNAIVLLEPLAEASGDRHLAACAEIRGIAPGDSTLRKQYRRAEQTNLRACA